jgi:glycosyltransferase involved in cell wall biosynthesis
MSNVAFITTFCSHYRVRAFETLARYYPVDYYFFSAGDDWYWQQAHGVRKGNFNHQYLPGFYLGRTRITPTLPVSLWRKNYDVYIKCINGRFALPVSYLVARLKKKPFILWTGIWMRLTSFHQRLLLPFTLYIYRHADAIVVYGEHVKSYLIDEGVTENRIFIAAQVVDNDLYSQTVSDEEKKSIYQRLDILPDQKIILYLGRLEPEKGLTYLLEAFASLKRSDATILFAGDGIMRGALEEMASRLGIAAQIRFADYVPTDEAPKYYALAWVGVLPSITTSYFKEPWGLVVNEAFNQGTPMIVSDSVGAAIGGLLQHDVNGLIVPEQNSDLLAGAIKRVLDEPGFRNNLGRNAKEIIVTWDYENMILGFRKAIEFVQLKRPKKSKKSLLNTTSLF